MPREIGIPAGGSVRPDLTISPELSSAISEQQKNSLRKRLEGEALQEE
jgi:hypothetical protein